MKRLIVVLLLLAAVAFGLWIILFKLGEKELPAGSDAFAINDTGRVQRILMFDKNNNSALIERHPEWGWSINGKYKARPSEVKNLLNTSQAIRVVRRIPERQHDLVVANLASKHVRVEIWSARGKLMKKYYVGWETERNEGNYMWMEGLDEVYIVNMPGFMGHLSSYYFIEEDNWRDREVFAYTPDRIRNITVIYHDHPMMRLPMKSFSLDVIRRDSFTVSSAHGVGMAMEADQRKALSYLGNFSSIHYEALANLVSHKDSVLTSQPFCTMSVTDADGEVRSIDIYFKPVSKRTKLPYDQLGNPIPYDPDRFYATVNDGRDFAIIQDFVFGKLFASYEWFLLTSEP